MIRKRNRQPNWFYIELLRLNDANDVEFNDCFNSYETFSPSVRFHILYCTHKSFFFTCFDTYYIYNWTNNNEDISMKVLLSYLHELKIGTSTYVIYIYIYIYETYYEWNVHWKMKNFLLFLHVNVHTSHVLLWLAIAKHLFSDVKLLRRTVLPEKLIVRLAFQNKHYFSRLQFPIHKCELLCFKGVQVQFQVNYVEYNSLTGGSILPFHTNVTQMVYPLHSTG